jgi:hypothetical protein
MGIGEIEFCCRGNLQKQAIGASRIFRERAAARDPQEPTQRRATCVLAVHVPTVFRERKNMKKKE